MVQFSDVPLQIILYGPDRKFKTRTMESVFLPQSSLNYVNTLWSLIEVFIQILLLQLYFSTISCHVYRGSQDACLDLERAGGMRHNSSSLFLLFLVVSVNTMYLVLKIREFNKNEFFSNNVGHPGEKMKSFFKVMRPHLTPWIF